MKKKNNSNDVFDRASMLLSSNSPFSVQEAYKTLRTNVIFSIPGSDCKCIGITSANRGEGKSTIAVNLSLSLAQLERKVVLIDCDMRLPTVITKLGIKAQNGLSDFLSGSISEIPVVRIGKQGIDIIPSGTIPPDSTALIDSELMHELVNELKKMYDYIIFDFPPINIVTDAALLSGVIDGYLIIIRNGYSENQKVNEALRMMKFANANILGFVYNGRGSDSKKYYKKRRGYYYNSDYYYYRKQNK